AWWRYYVHGNGQAYSRRYQAVRCPCFPCARTTTTAGRCISAYYPSSDLRISLDEVAREANRLHNREVCSDRNIIYNPSERGNTASTSHFVALKDNIINNRIASGDNVIFSITASGLNVGTALYTFDDLPDRLRRTGLTGEEI